MKVIQEEMQYAKTPVCGVNNKFRCELERLYNLLSTAARSLQSIILQPTDINFTLSFYF